VAGLKRSVDLSGRTPVRTRRLQSAAPVSPAELENLAREYRHTQAEHRSTRPGSRARRRLDARLKRLRRRFERLVAEAPLDEAERREWLDRLRGGSGTPGPTGVVQPLLFRGRSVSGSELRIVPAAGGALEAAVDGAAVAVLDDANELARTEPGLVFVLEGTAFAETFAVSRSALARLRDALEAGRQLPAESVRGLLADGLVDGSLDLTARGRRALALDRQPARHEEAAPTPAISVRGPVPDRARAELARMLAHVAHGAPGRVLHVTASLVRTEDPAVQRPVVAKATIDAGRLVARAQAAAATESEAIALLRSRLQRRLHGRRERRRLDVSEA
jgi:hypothetical protein